jgi:hypothetical protein
MAKAGYEEKAVRTSKKHSKSKEAESISLRTNKMFEEAEKVIKKSNDPNLIIAYISALVGMDMEADLLFSKKDPLTIWVEGVQRIMQTLNDYQSKPPTMLMIPPLGREWMSDS